MSIIYNKLGLLYQYENEFDSALDQHRKALYYAFSANDYNQEIGVSFNKIGIIHYYLGKQDSAILFFNRTIPYFKDPVLKANSYNNLALMYKYNSEPDKAISNYLAAYDLYTQEGEK